MRIQLGLILLAVSLNGFSADDKSMKELFKKYDSVIEDKKIELIDEIFTEKFIKDAGGKKELVEKIKGLSEEKNATSFTWQKSNKGDDFVAKVKRTGKKPEEANFIIKEIKGELKIDGQMSDAD